MENALQTAHLDPKEIAYVTNLLKQSDHNAPLAQRVREWALVTSGDILVTDCYTDLHLVTSCDKNTARQALSRLEKEGILERVGSRRGCYRLVDTTEEEIKWWEADTQIAPLVFPFGIHRLVNIYPKNIIIVAGATNAGKTALLLNIARLIKEKFKIYYRSSKMTKQELNKRLECFLDVGLVGNVSEWRKVIFRERTHDFHQVIKPDDINIIDYIEITSDHWKVADQINDIHKRLDKGIAIIALQKKKGTEYAIGGHYSAFRSRLYLAMENNELKIVKGKNWAGNINPNGKTYRFKLVQGSKFVEQNY